MRLLKEKLEIKYSILIFGGVFILIAFLAWLYWKEISDTKWLAIISGLLTGFIIVFVQLLLSWRELEQRDKYDELKIEEVLLRRNNKDYYRELLSKAKKRVMVQGVTAQRLLHDFANRENSEDGAKVLLEALGKGVEVRILVPSMQYLANEADKRKASMAAPHLKALSSEFPQYFKYAYFNHLPAHSIFMVDNESIVGPVFPGVSSEFTPAIHLKSDSEFAQKYLDYFDNEWEQWKHSMELQPG